jgi:CDP-diacylglycerol pyrophosphatase
MRLTSKIGAADALAAALLAGVLLVTPACGSDPGALRRIVQEECVAHWAQRHDPAPCERVELSDPPREDSGYALLADRKGGAHLLLIPTRRITGIESADLALPAAPNYLSAAWRARDRLEAAVGRSIPRSAVGLAVNPVHARTQNQLHIHIECLRPDVLQALAGQAGQFASRWRSVRIGTYNLEAREIAGETLDGENPFKLLNDHILEEHGVIGEYTLVIAGTQSASGPGFIVLTSRSVAGELLLDSTCAAAPAPP